MNKKKERSSVLAFLGGEEKKGREGFFKKEKRRNFVFVYLYC